MKRKSRRVRKLKKHQQNKKIYDAVRQERREGGGGGRKESNGRSVRLPFGVRVSECVCSDNNSKVR